LGDGGGSMWGSSGYKKMMESSQRHPCPPPGFNCGERRWKMACNSGD
jgi:hypothetical protein